MQSCGHSGTELVVFEVSKLQRWLKSWKKLLVVSFLEILAVGMDFINAGPD